MSQVEVKDKNGIARTINTIALVSADSAGNEIIPADSVTLANGQQAGAVESHSPLSGTLTTAPAVIVADTTTVHRTTFNPPIKAAVINIRHTSSTDQSLDDGILLVAGNQTLPVATEMLKETNISPRLQVKPSDGEVNLYFNGGEVSYIDLIGVGTAPTVTVTLGGIR